MKEINNKIIDQEKRIKYGYIYKTTIHDESSELNNHYYIGQHVWSKDDIDPNYFGSGKKIREYIHEYGTKTLFVEIIDWGYNKKELDELEFKYVGECLDDLNCLNITQGGYTVDPETIRKCWEDENIRNNQIQAIRNKLKDPEIRNKISIKSKKRYSNVFERQRQSEIIKQTYINHPELKEKRSNAFKNKKWYNNGKYQTICNKKPDGDEWVEGRLYSTYPNNWQWYNNGEINIKYKECPNGFVKNRIHTYEYKHRKYASGN